ncbi:MAG: hypothetical protein V1743_05030, partial [Nanoarchaeota archaeon]
PEIKKAWKVSFEKKEDVLFEEKLYAGTRITLKNDKLEPKVEEAFDIPFQLCMVNVQDPDKSGSPQDFALQMQEKDGKEYLGFDGKELIEIEQYDGSYPLCVYYNTIE